MIVPRGFTTCDECEGSGIDYCDSCYEDGPDGIGHGGCPSCSGSGVVEVVDHADEGR